MEFFALGAKHRRNPSAGHPQEAILMRVDVLNRRGECSYDVN